MMHWLLVILIAIAAHVGDARGDPVDDANALISRGQLARAQQLIDAHAPVEALANLEHAPLPLLQLGMARARLLAALGDSAAAIALRERLQPALDRALGADHPQSLENGRALAVRLLVAGEGKRAVDSLRELASRSRVAHGDADITLRIELTLADVLGQTEAGAPAIALLQSVVARAERREAPAALQDEARFSLAQRLRRERRVDEAVVQMQHVHRYRQQTYGPDDRRAIDAALELAHAYAEWQRLDLAIALAEDGRQRAIHANGVDAPQSLRASIALAGLLDYARDYRAAAALYAQVLPAAVRVMGDDDPFVVDAIVNAVSTGYAQGDASACKLAPLVYEHARRAGAGQLTVQGQALAVEGQCAGVRGELATAIERFEQELALRRQRAAGVDTDVLFALRNLADVLIRAGREARARDVLHAYVAEVEKRRREPGGAYRASLAEWIDSGERRPGYRTLVELEARAGRSGTAMTVAELAKGRGLERRDDEAAAERRAQGPAREAIDAVKTALARYELAAALEQDPLKRADITAHHDRLRQELAALHAALVDDDDATPPSSPLGPDATVPASELLVSYVVNGAHVTALVRHGADAAPLAQVIDLPDAGAAVDAARRAWGVGGDSAPIWSLPDGRWVASLARPHSRASRVTGAAALARLDRLLTPSLRARLKPGMRLVVSPDGPLALLPFELLSWRGRPLGSGVDVHYAHSQRTLMQSRARAVRYEAQPRDALLVLAVGAPSVDAASLDPAFRRMRWPRLPGVEREAKAVVSTFGTGHAVVRYGFDASESAVKALAAQGALARFRMIHVAAHAWYSNLSPDLSALVLGERDSTDASAGYLTAAELRALDVRSDLVVLSACSSSGGAVQVGEGLVGLVHALFAAGSAGAVVSLWPVADESTATLMADFYRRIGEGARPGAALAQAKRALAKAGAPPGEWAAFVYYGAG